MKISPSNNVYLCYLFIYLFWLFFSEQIFIEWWNCGHLEQFLFVIIEQKQSEISNSLLLQL